MTPNPCRCGFTLTQPVCSQLPGPLCVRPACPAAKAESPGRRCSQISDFNQLSVLGRIGQLAGTLLIFSLTSACAWIPILCMCLSGARYHGPIEHFIFSTMRVQENRAMAVTPISCSTCLVHDCCLSPALTGMTLGIGNYLWAFLDPDSQTLSEHLMGIHTVRTDPTAFPQLRPERKKGKAY
jgi:hypothetical protein